MSQDRAVSLKVETTLGARIGHTALWITLTGGYLAGAWFMLKGEDSTLTVQIAVAAGLGLVIVVGKRAVLDSFRCHTRLEGNVLTVQTTFRTFRCDLATATDAALILDQGKRRPRLVVFDASGQGVDTPLRHEGFRGEPLISPQELNALADALMAGNPMEGGSVHSAALALRQL